MFEMQEEIKKSRHEDGMNMVKLGNIATYVNGYAFKPDDRGDYGLPIIRIQDLTGNTYDLGFYDGDYPKKIEINNGDILISWSASLGVYEWKRGKALLNQHIFKVVFDKEVDVSKKYFVYAVKYKLEELSRKSHGATMKHVIKKDFDNTKIPFPSFVRQKEIAERLEKTSKIISGRKKQLQKLDELIQARFVELFGDPITNSFGWEEHWLDEYIEFLTSGSRGWAKYFTDVGNELFITIKNVKNNQITIDNIQYINAPNSKEAKRTRVKTGDLLISITADLGRTGVVDEAISKRGAYINQHLSLVRLDQTRINPLYVSYFLETEGGKKQFESKNQNGVKAGLNFEAIRSLKILVPPMELQEKYLTFVNQVHKSKVEIQQALEKTQLLFDSLMQQYFG